MKKFKKLSVMLSVILCMSMLMSMGTVFAAEESAGINSDYESMIDEAMLEIKNETGIEIEVQDKSALVENNISPEEFKREATEQVTNYLLQMGLAVGMESTPVALNEIPLLRAYPPGSTTQNFSGSGLGKVWA